MANSDTSYQAVQQSNAHVGGMKIHPHFTTVTIAPLWLNDGFYAQSDCHKTARKMNCEQRCTEFADAIHGNTSTLYKGRPTTVVATLLHYSQELQACMQKLRSQVNTIVIKLNKLNN